MIAWKLLQGVCWLVTILVACALAAITLLAFGAWILGTMIVSATTRKIHS